MGGASAPTPKACSPVVAHCRRRGLDGGRSCTRGKYRRRKCERLPTPARPARTGSTHCIGALRVDRHSYLKLLLQETRWFPDLTVDSDSNSGPPARASSATGLPASIGTLLAPRLGLADQRLAGRSFTRRSSCAFAATMMVDTLIATAPTLMGRSNPQRTSSPPAIGMETRL